VQFVIKIRVYKKITNKTEINLISVIRVKKFVQFVTKIRDYKK